MDMQNLFSNRFTRIRACSAEDFSQACIEVMIICISAFLPIWLGLFVLSITTLLGSMGAFLTSFMTSGDALLIACGIIGPLIYVLTKKYGRLEDPLTLRFPYSPGLSLLILVIWVIAGVVFVLKKMSDLQLLSPTVIDKGAIWNLSLFITFGSVTVLYFATVFRNNMDHSDPAVLMHNEQEEFVKDYENG
jgi:hypothetical protein